MDCAVNTVTSAECNTSDSTQDAPAEERPDPKLVELENKDSELDQALSGKEDAVSEQDSSKCIELDQALPEKEDLVSNRDSSKCNELDQALPEKENAVSLQDSTKSNELDHALSEKENAVSEQDLSKCIELDQALPEKEDLVSKQDSSKCNELDQALPEKESAVSLQDSTKSNELGHALPVKENAVSEQDLSKGNEPDQALLEKKDACSKEDSSNCVELDQIGDFVSKQDMSKHTELEKDAPKTMPAAGDKISPPTDSNLCSSSDNSKTDIETEPGLQIVKTVSLSVKLSKESVSVSETNAAVNSILEQPATEKEETQVADKERNQLIDSEINTSKESGEESSQEHKDSPILVSESVVNLKDSVGTSCSTEMNKLTDTPTSGGDKTLLESKSSDSKNQCTSVDSETTITEPENTKIGTGTKLTSTDGEEEVCIVPDTEPRVPTEQEKADAFEKANKTSGILDETSEMICENNIPGPTKSSQVTSTGRASVGMEEKTEEEMEVELNSGPQIRKFGIQLVSTSSLVSRQTTADQDQNILPSHFAQDGIQPEEREEHMCAHCKKLTKCKYHLKLKGIFLCEDECYTAYRKEKEPPPVPQPPKVTIRPRKLDKTYVHRCGLCLKKVDIKLERSLTWETMDFCSDDCLEKYQMSFGSHCANCKAVVQSPSLGKYCVRFGYDMKQFCDARCLEDFKKGLKVCSYCQKDISADTNGFLAPVGDKGQFKDFCSQECMEKYDQMSHNTVAPEVNHECAVCNICKPVKVEVMIDSKVQKLCSEPCFAAFKFANDITADKCDMCKKYYDLNRNENFTVYYDDAPHSFCCKTCMNVYILAKRKIVPCSNCKVKKYNFDMIRKTTNNGQVTLMMCSLHCLNAFELPSTKVHSAPKKNCCEFCSSCLPTLYHLSMSDASVRSFCSTTCVASFQGKFQNKASSDKSPYPLGAPRKLYGKKIGPTATDDIDRGSNVGGAMPVISSVKSLAPSPGSIPPLTAATAPSTTTKKDGETIIKTVFKQQYIVRPPVHPNMSNCAVQVKPKTATKEVSCQPDTCSVGTQTDDSISKTLFIPVPIPIFIPTPMHMYTSPYPVPVPIALPIPVPIFIPTTRNSSKGILKEINRIQEKIPSDPYEAELLMMAEMVADDKRVETTDSESDDAEEKIEDIDPTESGNTAEADFSPETVTNNTFGNDVLQMALKMASEYDESGTDFETPDTSDAAQKTPAKSSNAEGKKYLEEDETRETELKTRSARKRSSQQTSDLSPSVKCKRSRKSSASDTGITPAKIEPHADLIIPKVEPVERPDANMSLKFTLGANAWKNWVVHKNEELVKTNSSKNVKLFKQDILQLTADELNYSLCLFVKEVVNPNGQEYAPDTVYYLCLGIQQYLVENGRIENIFCDPNYAKFTSCLDDVVKKFSNFNTDTNILVTRIEEEHLWESKQLGAHSPYVLLNTLIYFNTKHFNLMTVEEHTQLSFSHIMKHWKRPPNATGPLKPGCSRNVLLRFYPPQSALAANSKKKKVYEQQENELNPLRCPVKLYEFYLSKCPESVKTRNDVFYLLPERSCVPDSPVWYSTMALGDEQLHKMLNRIRLVKEIVML